MTAAAPREEHLRTTGSHGMDALALSAWRGRSGNRYVVSTHHLAGFDPDDMAESVVIAVRRSTAGIAELVSAAAINAGPRAPAADWIACARRDGATEIHVHRLADGDAERGAVLADLAGAQRKPGR